MTSSNSEAFRAFVIEVTGHDPGSVHITPPRRPKRFSTNGDPQDASGAYYFHGNYGRVYNYRAPDAGWRKWRVDHELSAEEEASITSSMDNEKKTAKAKAILAGVKVREDYAKLKITVVEAHPYLERKNIKAPNLFIDGGALQIPLYNSKREHVNTQRIFADGRKKTYLDAEYSAVHFIFGEIVDRFIIVEGFATGATLYETVGWPVVMAGTAGNLVAVTKYFRKFYPNAEIIIAADDDASATSNRIGEREARRAAQAVGAKISLPPFDRTQVPSDKSHSDWNDYARVCGKDIVRDKFFECVVDPNAQQEQETVEALRGASDVRPPTSDVIRELNSTFFFTNENGKSLIYEEMDEEDDDGSDLRSHTTEDFCKMFRNRFQMVEGKKVKLGDYWLDHPERRQYLKGVIFDPRSRERKGYYNLYRGFGLEPSGEGSWSRLREHLRSVVCGGVDEYFQYLMNWLARAVQFPWELGEVIVVLRGEQGSGKGVLGNALMEIFGVHAMHITQANQLVGQYNGHLRNKLYIFADEAFFAGDKKHIAVLKALATDSHTTYEFKHRNATQGRNYLHILMASNEKWVVPAAERDRRFFVLDVKNTYAQQTSYFDPMNAELKNGGYEAMLQELLNRDISRFNVRDFPKTDALNDQKMYSMTDEDKWMYDVLDRGYVYEPRGNSQELLQWSEVYSLKLLQLSYNAHARTQSTYKLLTHVMLGKYLSGFLKRKQTRPCNLIIGEHMGSDGSSTVVRSGVGVQVPAYYFGTLLEARRLFEEYHDRKFPWSYDISPTSDDQHSLLDQER